MQHLTLHTFFSTLTIPMIGFIVGGLAFFIGGIAVLWHSYGPGTAVVTAQCIDLGVHDWESSIHGDFTTAKDVKQPTYRYRYDGKEYTAQVAISSNRPGYSPSLGTAKIRISRKHPDRVISSENIWIAGLFLLFGVGWTGMAVGIHIWELLR